jgi:hypothetical protein
MASRWLAQRPGACFAWGLAGFALFQLGLAVAVEHRLPGVRDPEYADKLERLEKCIADAPGRPLVLMLGSSRTIVGFEAGRLSGTSTVPGPVVFNFGLTGGCSFLELISLQRLLATGIRPDLLLVEVLPVAFNQLDDRPLEEVWLSGTRLRTAEVSLLDRYHSDPTRLLRHWCECRCLPCAWRGRELQQSLRLDVHRRGLEAHRNDIDSHGWRCGFPNGMTKEERLRQTACTRWQYEGVFGDFHLAEGAAGALCELLDRCSRTSIPTTLVLMPEGSEFRSWYTPAMRAGIDSYLQAVSRTRQVPMIDARTWVADDDFQDAHHLIAAGARVFTDRLAREANLLGAVTVASR